MVDYAHNLSISILVWNQVESQIIYVDISYVTLILKFD